MSFFPIQVKRLLNANEEALEKQFFFENRIAANFHNTLELYAPIYLSTLLVKSCNSLF